MTRAAVLEGGAARRGMRDRRLRSDAIWNFAGLTLPLGAAFLALPPLFRGLGSERMGVLAMGWTLIGYVSLFDLGLGRALTRFAAARRDPRASAELAAGCWTALVLVVGLGVCAGALVLACGNAAARLLHLSAALGAELPGACAVVAFTVPVVTATAACRGLLEACRRFAFLNVVRMAAGAASFAAPALLVGFTHRLDWMLATLAAARVLTLAAYAYASVQSVPALRRPVRPRWRVAAALARFGTWLTVSNLVSPLMTSCDRFLIAGLISVEAVTYYTMPSEIVARILLIPAAIAGVLFPALSGVYAESPAEAGRLYRKGLARVAACLLPVVLLAAILARTGMALWLGADMAERTFRVMRILLAGAAANGLAAVALVFVQAAGHPDWTAKLHLAELPLYAAAVWYLIPRYGIEGAALAWSLRVILDAALLLGVSEIVLRPQRANAALVAASLPEAVP